MIGTLLRRHLRHQRWLLAVLIAAFVGFQVLIIAIGSVIDRGPGLMDTIARLPAWIQRLLEQQIGQISFPLFPAFGFEHPAVMITGLGYVVFVATIPAGERDSGVLDLLLARPLRRREYLAVVGVQVVFAAVVFPLCLLGGVALGLALVDVPDEPPWTRYTPAAVGLALFLWSWGGVAMLLATGRQRRGRIVTQLIAVMVVLFLLHAFTQITSRLDAVAWLSPFNYFHPLRVVMRGEPMLWNSIVLAAIAVITMTGAFLRFERRDL